MTQSQRILTDTTLLKITDWAFISDHLESRLVPEHLYSDFDTNNRCYIPVQHSDFAISLAVRISNEMAIAINDQYLTTIGKSFDQLWNTWVQSEPSNIKCEPLNDVIATFWQSLPNNTPKETLPIYVCTTQNCDHGGAAIMHPAIQKHFLNLFQEPFFIIFSSIHESLIIPVSQGNPSDLQTMLRDVNSHPDIVSPNDVATNYVYICPALGQIKKVVI